MKNEEKAYEEILNLLDKHSELINLDITRIKEKAEHHLFGLKLKNVYGLDIEPKQISSLNWVSLGSYLNIGLFGEDYGRTISWSDNNEQPQNELLLYISFPTGAYIFGDEYPVDHFNQFFEELKAYKPKYVDTANNSLYFTLDNSKEVFNSFGSILKRYRDSSLEFCKKKRIEKMESELEELKNS